MRKEAVESKKPKVFVGIDCSSKSIHYVWLDDKCDIVSFGCWKSKQKAIDDRAFELVNDFRRFVDMTLPVDAIATVETGIYVQNPVATIGIAQVIMNVKQTLHDKGIHFQGVDPKAWKKSILGKGNAGKDEIKRFALAKWNLGDGLEMDYYDAACIAFWGFLRFGDVTRTSKET